MSNRCVLGSLVVCGLLVQCARADWTQFRGSKGQGHAEARDLPERWSEKENVAWKVKVLGKGWSSPVIHAGQIWMTTAYRRGRSLRALCFDEATGEIVHNVELFSPSKPERVHVSNSHASPSPVIEDDRAYFHFGTMGTACVSTRTAEVLWRQEMTVDHLTGPGSSPVLFEGRLFLQCDGLDEQFMAALDNQTGRVQWKTARSGPSRERMMRRGFATPLVINSGGRIQLISPAADHVHSYDPVSGKELWRACYKGFSTVPRPVFGNEMVYVCTGFHKPELLAIRVDGTDDVTDSHVVWRVKRQVPLVPSPILVGDNLYMVSDNGVATCLNAHTGEMRFQTRLGGKFSASPVFTDGRIYFASENGNVSVIEVGDTAHILAVNRLNGVIMASPAVSGQALYVRTDRHLYRIEKPPASAASLEGA
jgi:outer membrane protein assembly factor BamB